jgi:phosphatidate cytidylyltransferase
MLKARVITALFLVVGLLAVLFAAPPALAAVAFGVVAALAAWEWAGLMKQEMAARVFYAGFVVVSCVVAWGNMAAFRDLWLLSAAFWLLLAPFWLWRRWLLSANDFVGYAVGWILVVPTWAAMVALHQRSPWLLLAGMSLVWVADIAAYFSGRAFGRRKLAPAISPGKTWEGAIGAVAAVLGYGMVLMAVPAGLPSAGVSLLAALALLLLTAVSIVGDLFESLVKRQAEVKDSSQLLPGHGGVLDRIDSLTATLPLAALVLLWKT